MMNADEYKWTAEVEEIITRALDVLRPLPSMQAIIETGIITLAKVFQAQGRSGEALEVLQRPRRLFADTRHYAPLARVEATEALICLRQQNLSAVQSWVDQSGLQPTDEPSYLNEIDYLVFARFLIANKDYTDALILLEKLESAVQIGGRVGHQIVVLLLQALAHDATGARKTAQDRIQIALELGRANEYLRTIVDEGSTLTQLLHRVADQGVAVDYINKLLTHFDEVQVNPDVASTAGLNPQLSKKTISFINPLTDRESLTLR